MIKALFSCCFCSDQTSTALHFQKNKIQIVILAFNRLKIYPGLHQTVQPESSNLAVYALFLNILRISHVLHFVCFALFPNTRCPCYFYSCKTYLQAHLRFHLYPKYLFYFNPLQCLQPLSSAVLANIPLVYNAQQHCHHVHCQNAQHGPCTVFQCVSAIFSVSTRIL